MSPVLEKCLEPCPNCGGTGRSFVRAKIGAALRKLRLEARISLGDVARRMQVSTPYLSDVEHGNRGISRERIEQYLRAFGRSLL